MDVSNSRDVVGNLSLSLVQNCMEGDMDPVKKQDIYDVTAEVMENYLPNNELSTPQFSKAIGDFLYNNTIQEIIEKTHTQHEEKESDQQLNLNPAIILEHSSADVYEYKSEEEVK